MEIVPKMRQMCGITNTAHEEFRAVGPVRRRFAVVAYTGLYG